MNLKIAKEKATSTEIIFSDITEQSIELDYILPDYFPEIFRIVKCVTTPQILSYNIENTKLTYEMAVCIRVLYCTENSNSIHAVNQKLTYSKKFDIAKACFKPEISLIPQITFLNCRVVNPRRIDIRGAVSTAITVTDICSKDIISDIDGCNIQQKKMSFTYPSNHLITTAQLVVSDKFDVGVSKPEIIDIIRNDAIVSCTDKKIIADKVIIKGEIYVNMLYTCLIENSDNIEAMQFTIPFSHIIDIEGIDDRFDCIINADVISCEIIPYSDGNGNSKIADCNVGIMLRCSAYKTFTAEFVVDEYSTVYETNSEITDITLEAFPYYIDNIYSLKYAITSSDGEIECIYDTWCTLKNISASPDIEKKSIQLNGTITYMVLTKSTDGKIILSETEDYFTYYIPSDNLTECSKAYINLTPVSCSYTLSSDNTIEIKTELRATGCIKNYTLIKCITDITVNEDEIISKNNDYALKIYYTNEKEDLWEIAKKYYTPVSAIIEENEIEDDMIPDNGMLLIQIV